MLVIFAEISHIFLVVVYCTSYFYVFHTVYILYVLYVYFHMRHILH